VTVPGVSRTRRWRRLVIAAVAALLLAISAPAYLSYRLVSHVERVDGAFAGLTDRPAEKAPQALDILLTSADMVTLLHIDGDREGAALIWLPGGTDPDVGAVEGLAGIRIDHVAHIDWAAFRELESSADPFWPPFTEDGLTNPRILGACQQAYLKMLMDASLHQEMRTHPRMLYHFLDTISRHLTIDREWSDWDLARLVMSLRGMRSADIRYLTAPTGRRASALWKAVAHDRLGSLDLLRSPGHGSRGIEGRACPT